MMDYYAPPTRDCVALVVYSEARGEVLLGQLMVAKTLINRSVANSNGLCEEAARPGQFHGFENYVWPNKFRPNAEDWRRSRWVADMAIEWFWNVHAAPCGQPIYFNAGKILKQYEFLCTIGNHHFYK